MGQSVKIEQATGTVDHRLAVLRHELGNALNGLCGATGMLRATTMNPEQERWLDAIESSAAQIAFLVRDSKRGQPTIPVDAKAGGRPLNGIRLLERTLTAHASAARERGARLLLSIDPALPAHWRCPDGPIRQVLDNLLDNALKFAPGGDVVVAAEALPGKGLRLSVTDTGQGLDRAEVERVFGAYRRGSNCDAAPGTGLGLHVCRLVADALGGRIRYHPVPGSGACFTIDLEDVLEDGPTPRVAPVLLAPVRCIVELDDRLSQVAGKLLDRLNVRWTQWAHAYRAPLGDQLEVRISTVSSPGVDPGEVLVLQPVGGDPALVGGVLLPSVLESALLRLVLEWRWRNDQEA